jgi:hypothetical protein
MAHSIGGTMKVRELQQRLSKLDPELDALCYTEDAQFVAAAAHFTLLEIEDVTITHGERMRLDDGTPYLKLGKGPNSVDLATLVVTADF